MSERVPEQKTRRPKSTGFRRIVTFLIVVLAVLGGALAYLQTGDGFARVLLPLAGGLSGAQITARSGSLSLAGHLEADELRFHVPGNGLDILAAHLELELSPESLTSGNGPLRIESGVVRDVVVSMDLATGTTPPVDRKKKAPPDSELNDLLTGRIEIPVRIDRAQIERLTLRLLDGDTPRNVIGPLNLNLSNLGPQSTARGVLTTPLALDIDGEQPGYSGQLQAKLDLEQDQEGVLRGTRFVGDLHLARPDAKKGSGLALSMILDARSEEPSTLAATLTAEAKQNGQKAGKLVSSWRWREIGGAGVTDAKRSLVANLDLESIELVNLNPFLAAAGGIQAHGGAVDGKLQLTNSPDGPLGVSGNLNVRQIALALDRGDSDTPPLDIHAKQDLRWNRHTSILSVSQADLNIIGRHGRSMQAVLQSPLEMDLDLSDGNQASDQPTTISLEIERIDIAGVRRWLAAFGADRLETMEGGHVGVDVNVEVSEHGTELKATGTVDATALRIRGVKGEMGLHSELDLEVENYERFVLDHTEVTLTSGPATLLEGTLSGAYGKPPGSWDATLQIESGDLMKVMDRLSVLSPEHRKRIDAGKTSGRIALKTADGGAAEISGKLKLEAVALAGADPEVQRSVELTADLHISAERDELAIREFTVTVVESSGDPPGSVTAKGTVALAPGETAPPSQLTLAADKLKISPWIKALTGLDAPLGDLPLTANIDLTIDPAMATLESKGRESFQVVLSSSEGAAHRFTARATHQIKMAQAGNTDFDVTLTVPRAGGTPDQMKIQGKYTSGTDRKDAAPRLTIAANIERLDLTPYLGPFTAKRISHEGAEPSAPPVAASSTQPSIERALPLELDIDAKFEHARFAEIEIESSRLTAVSDASRMRFDLDFAETTGGSLEGHLDLRQSTESNAISWSIVGSEIDVGKFARSAAMAGLVADTQTSGTLALTSSATGSGKTPETLRQNLTGRVSALLSDSHISNIPVFEYLSHTTGIAAFQGILLSGCRLEGKIENDALVLGKTECTGEVANLQAAGQIGLDGQLDLLLSPRLGPSFSGSLGKVFLAGHLVETAGGFVALPIDIAVDGPIGEERMSVQARVPGALDRLTLGATSKVLDTGVKIGGGLIELGGTLLKFGNGWAEKRD